MKPTTAPFAALLLAVSLLASAVAPRTTRADAIWPGSGSSPTKHTQPARTTIVQLGFVINGGDSQVQGVKLRAAPRILGREVGTLPVGKPVVIYATVKGDAALDKDNTWYRISPPAASARYIYGHYVGRLSQAVPEQGKLILVSLGNQWLLAFQNAHLLLDTPITSGRPELPTPTGTYRVLAKYTPYTMISPWPKGSPFYYPTSVVRYALAFRTDGYFIHDAGWRGRFGPGTNLPHDDPGDRYGSHGCINAPLGAQQNLFRWADVGTTIQIISLV